MNRRWRSLVETAVLLLLGSQGVHHLRFLLAPDDGAGATLAGHGHGGFHRVATGPAIGVLIALVLAGLLARAAQAPSSVRTWSVRSRRVWPLAVVAVLAIYGSQELLEGVVGHGHEGGFAALTAYGGWVAIPVAIAIGGLIALAVRVARAAEALVMRSGVRIVLVLRRPAVTVLRGVTDRSPRAAFSLYGAGRGPPVVG